MESIQKTASYKGRSKPLKEIYRGRPPRDQARKCTIKVKATGGALHTTGNMESAAISEKPASEKQMETSINQHT